MKKSRNSFFAENSFQAYNQNLTGAPYQAASNYFYQGPLPESLPNNYNINYGNNDIESRISKIERQLNRLDYRISKLESTNNVITSDDLNNNNSNMYML